jgi:hypothetical protein
VTVGGPEAVGGDGSGHGASLLPALNEIDAVTFAGSIGTPASESASVGAQYISGASI